MFVYPVANRGDAPIYIDITSFDNCVAQGFRLRVDISKLLNST